MGVCQIRIQMNICSVIDGFSNFAFSVSCCRWLCFAFFWCLLLNTFRNSGIFWKCDKWTKLNAMHCTPNCNFNDQIQSVCSNIWIIQISMANKKRIRNETWIGIVLGVSYLNCLQLPFQVRIIISFVPRLSRIKEWMRKQKINGFYQLTTHLRQSFYSSIKIEWFFLNFFLREKRKSFVHTNYERYERNHLKLEVSPHHWTGDRFNDLLFVIIENGQDCDFLFHFDFLSFID